MFLLFGVNTETKEYGQRRAQPAISCCGTLIVSCTYQVFTLFFIPLFRFNRQYFATCPVCGTVYELPKAEGERAVKDPFAVIDASHIFIVRRGTKKTCPRCNSSVDAGSRFCPQCGQPL